ncbi:hypothetical protein BV22DRAFT_1050964 [Leucogyrophana mollusca]|uniref:Uncharacterized protein n=1 Tax=Leucogyrophana mollusca TaxID=85980 RepID=A0ACB8B1U6_9AGAM|nr:hypothetical protein BV22DRAFT_1050964 [Leucogyrophana mollusca]
MGRFPSLRCFASFALWLRIASAFSMIPGLATQCDEFSVSWTGGQPPFELILVPEYTIFIEVPVPSSAFANNQGTASIQELPLAQGKRFVAVMSDAIGFGSGGVSNIITVGGPVENNGCNTTAQSPKFYYDPSDTLEQCSQYAFNYFNGAQQPVNVTASPSTTFRPSQSCLSVVSYWQGLIPNGDSFVVQAPIASNYSYSWLVDVAAYTSLILYLTDSTGAQGGTTNFSSVAYSGDNHCLTGSYPSSTASAAPTTTGTPTASGTSATSSSGTSLSTGAIAGIAIGGAAILAAFAALLLCYHRHKGSPPPHSAQRRHDPAVNQVSGDLIHPLTAHPYPYPYPHQVDSSSQPGSSTPQYTSLRPWQYKSASQNLSSSTHLQHLPVNPSAAEFGHAVNPSLSSRERRSAPTSSEQSSRPSTRYLVHTDVDDARPENVEVVELPPEYSTNRQPIPSLPRAARGRRRK